MGKTFAKRKTPTKEQWKNNCDCHGHLNNAEYESCVAAGNEVADEDRLREECNEKAIEWHTEQDKNEEREREEREKMEGEDKRIDEEKGNEVTVQDGDQNPLVAGLAAAASTVSDAASAVSDAAANTVSDAASAVSDGITLATCSGPDCGGEDDLVVQDIDDGFDV